MKHEKLRVPTLLLAAWMLIVSIPVTAFAELLQMTTEPMFDDTVYVLAEDQSKRTAFEKHYYCSDGTFVAVTYPEAVHYQNEQGEWVDVDLRLSDHSVSDTYESQSGDFKASFSKLSTSAGDASLMSVGSTNASTPAVTLESGDYALSWSLIGTKPAGVSAGTYAINGASAGQTAILTASAQAEVQVLGEFKTEQPAVSVQKVAVTDPNAFALPSASNQIIYENIFGEDQNVSVRYSVSQNRIEEDFLITAPTNMTSFSMQVECTELTPVLNLDNSVDFLDNNGEMVYHVSTPYLADAAFAVSYDVQVTLTDQDGICIITYTPDAEWMNDPARVYPIMLDPAVTTKDYSYAISDTYLVEGDDTVHYTEQYLYVHQNDGKGRAAILRFASLPQIDSSMPIISATLKLPTYIGPNGVDLKLESMSDGFNFLMDRYSDWKTWNRTEIDSVSYASGTIMFEFDMTSCIVDLYSGSIGRDFSISLTDEDATTYVSPIFSADATFGDSYRPYLAVTYGYTLPKSLSADDVIQIQNVNSKGYLYPNSGLSGNGNIILHAPSATSGSAYRLATLTENASTGAYRIEYTPSGYHSGSYYSANKSTQKVVMHNTTSVPSDIAQEWLIVPYTTTTFKIVLASDMRYVMTAVGAPSGYLSDPSSATEGYVSITQCTNTPTKEQLWYIYRDGSRVVNDMTSALVDNGMYYLNHDLTGMFLRYTDDEIDTTRGRISTLGSTVSWQITRLLDGFYTLQQNVQDSSNDNYISLFLTDSGDGMSMTPFSGTYSVSQKWDISQTTAGYILINESTGNFLQVQNEPRTVWDLVKCTEYVELGYDVTFNNLTIGIGQTVQAETRNSIPANTTYASLTEDFKYTSSNPAIATVNTLTGRVTGVSRGVAEIEVIHKVTGMRRTFEVTVEKRAIIVIPGMGGSELFVGEGELFFKEGTPILSQEMVDVIFELVDSLKDDQTTLPYEDIKNLVQDYIQSTTILGYTTAALTGFVFSFIDQFYSTIQCNEYGISKHNIYTKKYYYIHDDNPNDDHIPCVLPQGIDENEYTPYAGVNNAYYELMYSLHSDPILSAQYAIELFTYDWRLSNRYAAEGLDAFIEENGYDKVILIAHSMGGLVASGYMGLGLEQLNKVQKVCMISSPLEGAPEVIYAWANLDAEKLFYIPPSFTNRLNAVLAPLTLTVSPLQKLISNYPSIYELFPTEYYISASQYQQPYVKYIEINKNSLTEDITTESYCSDYDSSMQVIPCFLPYFNPTLMTEAEDFHSSCRLNDRHITHEVDCRYYAGTKYDTTVRLDCVRTIKAIGQEYEVVKGNLVAGDSLVPPWSATVGRNGSCVLIDSSAGHTSIINKQINDILNFLKGAAT